MVATEDGEGRMGRQWSKPVKSQPGGIFFSF